MILTAGCCQPSYRLGLLHEVTETITNGVLLRICSWCIGDSYCGDPNSLGQSHLSHHDLCQLSALTMQCTVHSVQELA